MPGVGLLAGMLWVCFGYAVAVLVAARRGGSQWGDEEHIL